MRLETLWVEQINTLAMRAAPALPPGDVLLSPMSLYWSLLPLLRALDDSSVPDAQLPDPDQLWADSPSSAVRVLAGALLARDGIPLSDTLKSGAKDMGMPLWTVDFTSADTVQKVNAWISERTKGLIPSITDGFSPQTMLALMSALYASDAFLEPFDPADTRPMTFHGRLGDRTMPFMRKSETLYAQTPALQAALLPLSGGGGLCILLPEPGIDDIALPPGEKLFSSLNWSLCEGELLLPRFTLRYRQDCARLLAGLGLPPDTQSGRSMTDGIPLWADAVLHEAYLRVDEAGILGAAATLTVMAGALPPQQAKPFSMVCDRPFWTVLFDRNEALEPCALFIGRVSDGETEQPAARPAGPVMPVSAATGNPAKSLFAPFDGMVLSLLFRQTAMQVEAGYPLLLVRSGGQDHVLTAPLGGLIVYIPAMPGQKFLKGEALVWLL